MLATHLEPSFKKSRLPSSIYPFSEEDVELLCLKARSPRSFIQAARAEFQNWLDDSPAIKRIDHSNASVVTQDEIDPVLELTLRGFDETQRKSFEYEMLVEQDFFGRIRNLFESLLSESNTKFELSKATYRHFVMPPNFIVGTGKSGSSLCIAVMNSEGNSFAARMRNLNKCVEVENQFDKLVLIRDRRCRRLGAKSQEHLSKAINAGAGFVEAGIDEMVQLNAVYETLVAVEEHDLTVRTHEIDRSQLAAFLKNKGSLARTELFRQASRHSNAIAEFLGIESARIPNVDSELPISPSHRTVQNASVLRQTVRSVDIVRNENDRSSSPIIADVLIGDDSLKSPHTGLLGELKSSGKKLGISLSKPQCIVLLGYMGSGKSYALGVLIESALLRIEGLIMQSRPMCVVAFNYRRNSQARFEYGGFACPNTNQSEIERLRREYGCDPKAVSLVNVFCYFEEIPRRLEEYSGMNVYPIRFKPDELSAEHWEILMKPPTREAEYMDIIRDIIQKLFYQERLTFRNLEANIGCDERLSSTQRRKAMNRLSFAERWISDDRKYEWDDVLGEGSLNVFDLRMQALESSEALKLA